MQIRELKANPKNPRKISDSKLAMLKASVEEFGDLSGFVYNRRSKRLVSGHQKQKIFIDGLSGLQMLELVSHHPSRFEVIDDRFSVLTDDVFFGKGLSRFFRHKFLLLSYLL